MQKPRNDIPSADLFGDLRGAYKTILADPPWRFSNSTGKVAPEHKRLARYGTMSFAEIAALPVQRLSGQKSHLYLWCPNALLPQGLSVMEAWGFQYKGNIVWHKIRKDGGPDGRGVGFYFRNVTELILFGTRGKLRTGAAGRRQVNFLATRKREHSRKPDEIYPIIEACSFGPFLELFARHSRPGWDSWGDEVDKSLVSRASRLEQAAINPMYL
jgi:N6-adenosine-specific RNA methylase IME4